MGLVISGFLMFTGIIAANMVGALVLKDGVQTGHFSSNLVKYVSRIRNPPLIQNRHEFTNRLDGLKDHIDWIS